MPYSDVAREIIERMPPDTTSHEDMLLAALFTNEPVKAASLANDIDVWLACHLTDLLEALNLEGVAQVMAYVLGNHCFYLDADMPSEIYENTSLFNMPSI